LLNYLKMDKQLFYEDFYKLASGNNKIMNILLIQCHTDNNYKMFIEILKHISKIDILSMNRIEIINTLFCDQLLDDEYIDDWIKFKFFYQLESRCYKNIYYITKLLYKIKNIEPKYIDYIINKNEQFVLELNDSKFFICLSEKLDKEIFNNTLKQLVNNNMHILDDRFILYILQIYRKHPYFDYSYFDNFDKGNLLIQMICVCPHKNNIIQSIDFLNDISNNYYFSDHDLELLSNFFYQTINFIIRMENVNYKQLFGLITDYYVDIRNKKYDGNHIHAFVEIKSFLYKTVQQMIDNLCSNNITFYVSKKIYNAINASIKPYFTKEIDDKIKNMYIKQEKMIID